MPGWIPYSTTQLHSRSSMRQSSDRLPMKATYRADGSTGLPFPDAGVIGLDSPAHYRGDADGVGDCRA